MYVGVTIYVVKCLYSDMSHVYGVRDICLIENAPYKPFHSQSDKVSGGDETERTRKNEEGKGEVKRRTLRIPDKGIRFPTCVYESVL